MSDPLVTRESDRRLMLVRVPAWVDLCELLRGDIRAVNLPNDAFARRWIYEASYDAWLIQVWSASFPVVADDGQIPIHDTLFAKVEVPQEKP